MPEPSASEEIEPPRIERRILLLGDSWSCIKDGIAGVNRCLGLTLARYKGIKVYATIFGDLKELTAAERKEVEEHEINLILSAPDVESPLKKVNEDPLSVFPDLLTHLTDASFIVGHAPVTAGAAVKLKKSIYDKAKVILFYHTLPLDTAWLGDELPYPSLTDFDLVQLAQAADVVYSVTDKCHWYYKAKFRNRADKAIDHRIFYPQCSDEVFKIEREAATNTATPKILVLSDGTDEEAWLGIDIATCATNKILFAKQGPHPPATPLTPSIKIGGVSPHRIDELRTKLQVLIPNLSDLNMEIVSYSSPAELYVDLKECSICLVPSRAEPFGIMGLIAMSAGIPTLIAEGSSLATVIGRLTSDPDFFTVPVTQTTAAVKQDGSMWRDRAIKMLQNPEAVQSHATQIRNALKRDELTKESHDNFMCYCLGGIKLLHAAKTVEVYGDREAELASQRDFNSFLTSAMKQCWRLKHHPLTGEGDLFPIIPGIRLPIKDLMIHVTDKIEDKDRRIVGVSEETGAFIVYCPSPAALSDLWSNCDVINDQLIKYLLVGVPCPILKHFNICFADVKTTISGPEMLKYKKQLLQHLVIEENGDRESKKS